MASHDAAEGGALFAFGVWPSMAEETPENQQPAFKELIGFGGISRKAGNDISAPCDPLKNDMFCPSRTMDLHFLSCMRIHDVHVS